MRSSSRKQVVGEFDVGLVDLVDQQHHRLLGAEGLPQHALDDVVADVVHALRAGRVGELAVAQPADRVVLVEPLLGLGRALDVPLQQRHAQRRRDLLGQQGLAGARFALDQQRTRQRDRRVDGQHQVGRGDVLRGAGELHDWAQDRVSTEAV